MYAADALNRLANGTCRHGQLVCVEERLNLAGVVLASHAVRDALNNGGDDKRLARAVPRLQRIKVGFEKGPRDIDTSTTIGRAQTKRYVGRANLRQLCDEM